MAKPFLLLVLALGTMAAQGLTNRYALILEDAPVATGQAAGSSRYRAQIQVRQQTLRQQLATRGMAVAGAVDTLTNAVFVVVDPGRVEELRALPGVKGVVRLRRYDRKLSRATTLMNAPAAWDLLGGPQNSGAGVKIAILDSGIDQTHPSFQDASLKMPSGFPRCNGSDCAFTSNKVIVARSYVRQLAAGSPANPAADSRPDDYSPRDRAGHGTAVASCAAGAAITAPYAFSGIAPKAYLGNYKIYGSPQLNDGTTDDVIIQALEDALNDGMDIVNFSSGGTAFSAPLDSGAACGQPAGVPCDLLASVFETAAQKGLLIIAAAGNEGLNGNVYPTFGTIGSPANAPSVLAAGATTNSHDFDPAVAVPGGPANLQKIAVNTGDAYSPPGAWAFPLVDVALLGNDGFACSTLPAGSLAGSIALIQRGPATGACSFSVKMSNAANAGAVGAVFYMLDAATPIAPSGLANYGLPAGMVSLADGLALKDYFAANFGRPVSFQPAGFEITYAPNLLARFSSAGPNTGDAALKPDVLAVGSRILMAAQSYDPLGDVFSSDGFAVADGTSFASPITAGVAALVKQKHPEFSAAQIRSALMNSATPDVLNDSGGRAASVLQLGGGKLDAAAAVSTRITVDPPSLSFGSLTAISFPKVLTLRITNSSAAAITLNVSLSAAAANITLSKQTLTLPAGGSDSLGVSLTARPSGPGAYGGAVLLRSGSISLRVPYLYVLGTGTTANLIPLSGDGFYGTTGQPIPEGIVAFRLVDAFGLPVANVPVTFTQTGGGTLKNADMVTDANGIAGAEASLGTRVGNYSFTAVAGGQRFVFSGSARALPQIAAGGIANAASFDSTVPVAPGSYITITGTSLADFVDYPVPSPSLPLAIDNVNVSFDVSSAGISVPGRLTYASPTQVNLQVPWELQGQTGAQTKLTVFFSTGNVVNVALADYSPAFFEVGPAAAAVLDTAYKLVSVSNPAARGQTIQIYANGLGPVTNQPASGEPALASPLSLTKATPEVTIGGVPAIVSFSGLAPGFAGLYQLNVVVPAGIATGQQPLLVKIGGKQSKASGIVVQ